MIRLKQFQNQLREPKALHFEDSSVVFNHPVLQPIDVMKINSQTLPTFKKENEMSEVWTYRFKKKNGREDLELNLIFKQNQLTKIQYPKELAQLFEGYLITQAFESISKGTYVKSQNTVVPGNIKNLDKSRLPNKEAVISRLGKPSTTKLTTSTEELSYIYNVEGSNKEVVISFDYSGSKLKRVSGNLFGPHIAFGFK